MKRPFKDVRPIGPLAQFGDNKAQIAVYFEDSTVTEAVIPTVSNIVEEHASFTGDATGIHGELDNVVTFQTTGNQTTHGKLEDLKDDIEDRTGEEVDDIEVIW
jgi:hypothetical protein